MFAAVALLGCNREVVPVSPQEQNTISFGTVDTRAGLSDLQANGFGVWACVSSKDDAQSVQYEPLLENERVYFKNGEWTYDDTKYWIPNSMFYFFAAYPQGVFEQSQFEDESGKNYTLYTANITADGSADTPDILVATHVTDTTAESFDPDNVVPLSFNHLLSKVNVKISQNFDIDPDFNYYVTKVTITGVIGSATYGFLPISDRFMQAFDNENATTVTLEKEYDTPVILRNVGNANPRVELSVWGDGLMLLPQTIAANGVAIRVDYLYDVNLDDEEHGTAKFVEGFIPATTWESGKSISYSLAISSQSNIVFSQPTIEPWGAPQTGGTIIIK